jgi:hypothetical protein
MLDLDQNVITFDSGRVSQQRLFREADRFTCDRPLPKMLHAGDVLSIASPEYEFTFHMRTQWRISKDLFLTSEYQDYEAINLYFPELVLHRRFQVIFASLR